MSPLNRCGIGFLSVLLMVGLGNAGEWPEFRGPGRSGAAVGIEVPESWPESGPEEVWRRQLGSGFSGLSAKDGRVFTMFGDGEGEQRFEFVGAFDEANGNEIWRYKICEEFVDEFGNGPRSTPAVGGDTVFALSSRGQLVALDVVKGTQKWMVDFTQRFESALPRWGFSMSPVIVGDLVVVEIGGGEGEAFAAFDRDTGETTWTGGDGRAGYSSPQVATIHGQRQIVFLHNGGLAESYDPGGKVLWTYQFAERAEVVAMPVYVAPDSFFFSAPNRAGGALVSIEKTEDGFTAKEVWRMQRMRNHWSNSVVSKSLLFGFDNASLRCLDLATGEQLWSHRGFGKGSLVIAGDKLIILSDTGDLVLGGISREAFIELGRVGAMKGRCWTAPSIVGDKIVVRNHEEMVSYRLAPVGGAS